MSEKVSKFESVMVKMSNVVEQKISPPLIRFGNNRYMLAIRAGLIRIIPLLIIGSFPLILTNLPVKSWADAMMPFNDSLNALFNMTFGFMGLYLSICIGAEMARTYKLEVTTVSVVTLVCFLITASPVDLVNGTISIKFFGSTGMFTSFIVGIVVAEVMRFMRDKNIGIKMPRGVPENISASFSSLVPMAVLFVFFWFLRIVIGFEITELINRIISPILILADTWYAVLLTSLILCLLWFVGIHGGSMTVQGVMYAFLFSNISANAAAHAAGLPMPHVFSEPFVFTYGMPTGIGITLPLILLWLRSKSARLKEVSRISLIPGFFNINEPILFGAPLIMNPIMFLPMVFGTTTFGMMYGYIITRLGLVNAPFIQVPWTTPVLIQPYLATGGDWRAVIAQLILLVVVALVWYPFAKTWEKTCINLEQAEAGKAK